MLRNVAVVVTHGFHPFEFGVVCEVFGIDRTDDGLPSYDFAIVGAEPGPLRSSNAFTIQPVFGLERLAEADLIALPAVGDSELCFGAFRASAAQGACRAGRCERRPVDVLVPFPGCRVSCLTRCGTRSAGVRGC